MHLKGAYVVGLVSSIALESRQSYCNGGATSRRLGSRRLPGSRLIAGPRRANRAPMDVLLGRETLSVVQRVAGVDTHTSGPSLGGHRGNDICRSSHS